MTYSMKRSLVALLTTALLFLVLGTALPEGDSDSSIETQETDFPSPGEAPDQFEVADNLAIDLLLHEPEVAQPVFFNFDERGRMWVVQYLQYPHPAGLTIVSRDQYWRNVYDRIPPPPPNHFRGLDKITIHEDTNGDGIYNLQKTFLDGLNIVTAVERGRGGVWVLNPPYLLFYADRDNDDVPDGDPEVHLEGFGLEDTHSVVNSLRWGPDGWLYAAQGSTVTGHVVRPETDDEPQHSMGQLIWRYHPESRRYEIFAEGGGNTFGVEFDSEGRIFSGHNGGDTRGFHYVQGGYLQKGFSKHGGLSNPYTFGYFSAMEHHSVTRFTHNLVIYDHGALPEAYAGRLLGINPMSNRVVAARIEPDRSSFQTHDENFPLVGDDWFRPVDIKVGPDGAVYIADWHDSQISHYGNSEGQFESSTGRLWRLRAANAEPLEPFDLSRASTDELIGVLNHENRWWRQTALRLLADRKDEAALPKLRRLLFESDGQLALEALWALNLSGGLDEEVAREALEHENPQVRLWTVRLLCDANEVSDEMARRIAAMAPNEPNLEVRSQLACSARRLPAQQSLPIVEALLRRDEDNDDIYLPLLLWWAIETHCDDQAEAVLEMLSDESLWAEPMVRQHIIYRIMQRFAMSGTRADLLTAARLFTLAPDQPSKMQLMRGFEISSRGQTLTNLPEELIEALAGAGGASLPVQVRQGKLEATTRALEIVADDQAEMRFRMLYLQIFGEVDIPQSVPVMLELLTSTEDVGLRRMALTALMTYDDDRIAAAVVESFRQLNSDEREVALTLLTSRTEWSLTLLRAVDKEAIDTDLVSMAAVRRLQFHDDERIAELIGKFWSDVAGPSSEEMRAEIARILSVTETGQGDPYRGKPLFFENCGKCHQLFGQGGRIGPDLTTYQRDDLATMLLSIVNPSAEIREGFENFVIITDDGLTMNGFLAEEDARVVVLRGVDGQSIVVPREMIDEMQAVPTSIMPEGVLRDLNDQQVLDLLSYLRSSQPLND